MSQTTLGCGATTGCIREQCVAERRVSYAAMPARCATQRTTDYWFGQGFGAVDDWGQPLEFDEPPDWGQAVAPLPPAGA